jgi:hypothetical protein
MLTEVQNKNGLIYFSGFQRNVYNSKLFEILRELLYKCDKYQ